VVARPLVYSEMFGAAIATLAPVKESAHPIRAHNGGLWEKIPI
jgi:hypothetical protein